MQTANGELTQPKSNQLLQENREWEVVVGKQIFTLTGKQVDIIKQADKQGMRGMVWFDKFAISIPHIQSVSYIGVKNSRSLESTPPSASADIDPEVYERFKKRRSELGL